jgi:hypothetical protein
VTAPVLDRSEVAISPGFAGFADVAERIGLDLEPFQHRIAKAALSGERELLVLLPRGNGKTCLQALVALHHLLTVDDAEWPSSGEGPPSSQRQEGSRNMYRSLARRTAD